MQLSPTRSLTRPISKSRSAGRRNFIKKTDVRQGRRGMMAIRPPWGIHRMGKRYLKGDKCNSRPGVRNMGEIDDCSQSP